MLDWKGTEVMSGIFGYIGREDCRDDMADALRYYKHRGGDSCGVAFKLNDELTCIKDVGGVDKIIDRMSEIGVDCTIALAQNARSNRGKVSALTSSPACNNLFAVAMDGCIDNFGALRERSGNPFPIHTDEDLLLALLCVDASASNMERITRVDSLIKNSLTYAFFNSNENAIFCKKGNAPLYVGVAKTGFYISSEIAPLCDKVTKYFALCDGEVLRLTREKASVFDPKGKRVKRSPLPIPPSVCSSERHTIVDEAFYCPLAVKNAFASFVSGDKLNIPDLKFSRHSIERLSRIIITGTGEAYCSAVLGERAFGTLCDVPVYAVPSSELARSHHILDKSTLVVAVSASGEDMDTITAVKRARMMNARTLAITCNRLSYLADISSLVVCPMDYFDINFTSLRGFVSMYISLAFVALYFGNKSGVVSDLYLSVAIKMAESLAGKVTSSVKSSPQLELCADLISSASVVIATGYLGDYALALDACDKLISLAGINAFSCQLGEIEGRYSSVLDGATVVAFISDDSNLDSVMSYLRSLRSRGCSVIIFTASAIEEEIYDFESIVSINDSIPLFNPVPIIASFYKTTLLCNQSNTSLEAV